MNQDDVVFEVLDKVIHSRNGFFELQDNPLGLIMPIKTLAKALSATRLYTLDTID